MVWANLKQQVYRQGCSSIEDLTRVIQEYWEQVTPEMCNRYIDHVFKASTICVLMDGDATGDVPRKVFPESSRGHSFRYYQELLKTPEVVAKCEKLGLKKSVSV